MEGKGVFLPSMQSKMVETSQNVLLHPTGIFSPTFISLSLHSFPVQIGIFDQRGDCSRNSREYTGLPAGNENDEMCVVVKYKSVPTNIDAAKAIFTAFGTPR